MMNMPKNLILSVGALLIACAPLVQAAPGGPGGADEQRHGRQEQPHQRQGGPDRPDHDKRGPGNRGPGNPGGGIARGGPPQDFGPVRQTIQDHRDVFRPGNPPPASIRAIKGQPLPRGYGARLDGPALKHLPRYEGYEWRRMGTDVVLIAIGTGIVYEVLQGVLN